MQDLVIAIAAATAFMTLVMSAGWLVQRRAQNAGWSDVFWTFGTGLTLAAAALAPVDLLPAPLARRELLAALAAAWSLRLGLHIAARVAASPEDRRYVEMRALAKGRFQRDMLGLMLIQAPVSAILALAALIAAHAPGPLGLRDAAAVAVMMLAVAGEGLADAQLVKFKARGKGGGQICDVGLWAVCRHPNYLFEWLAWFAYPIMALGYGAARPWLWVSLAAPGLMYVLLNRVSGIPPLERAMLASRGEAYRRYQARVPAFLPFTKPGASQ